MSEPTSLKEIGELLRAADAHQTPNTRYAKPALCDGTIGPPAKGWPNAGFGMIDAMAVFNASESPQNPVHGKLSEIIEAETPAKLNMQPKHAANMLRKLATTYGATEAERPASQAVFTRALGQHLGE